MTKKITDEESDADSKEIEAAEDTEEETSEDPESSSQDEEDEGEEEDSSDVDYEAENQKEKDRVGKPDPLKAADAYKERQKKKVVEEDEEETEHDEQPLTRREAREMMSGVQKSSQEVIALQIARANTSSEAEAQAAVTFWKTRVIPTGNLEGDMMFAIGGLNHKRVIAKNKELSRALNSKNSVSKDAGSTHRDPMVGSKPKLPADQIKSLERAKFVYDPKTRLYKKKLPSGKFLIKDLKTKRTYVSA